MSIKKAHLQEHVIRPILNHFNLGGAQAEELLLSVAAQESHGGYYLVQRNGPALGIYQMEPPTYEDIVLNVISVSTTGWRHAIHAYFGHFDLIMGTNKLISDIGYATLLCRLQFWRYPEPLPPLGNVEKLYKYWKKYYNRNSEKGHFDQFKQNYDKHVKNE